MDTVHSESSKFGYIQAHELSHRSAFVTNLLYVLRRSNPFYGFAGERSSSTEALLNKLNDLANLAEGWHFGEGVPTKPEVLIATLDLYYRIARYDLKVDAFPWPNGYVTLVFYNADKCVEIVIRERDDYDVVVEQGHGFDYDVLHEIDNASFEDVRQALNKTTEPSWNLYESFTKDLMTESADDFAPPASQIQVMEPESRQWTWHVLKESGEPHAATLPSITRTSREPRLFIGSSQGSYLMAQK